MLMKWKDLPHSQVTSSAWLFRYIGLISVGLSPILLWNGIFDARIFMGSSDVPFVLLLNPYQFLVHTATLLSQGTFAGGTLYAQYIPMAVVGLIFRTLHINPIDGMSCLLLSGSFYYMSRLIDELNKDVFFKSRPKNDEPSFAGTYGAIVYSVSPLVSQLFFTNYLPRIQLLVFAPAVLYYWIRYYRSGKFLNLVKVVGLGVVCISGILDVPGSLPVALICVIILVVWHLFLTSSMTSSMKSGVRASRIAVGIASLLAGFGSWLAPSLFLMARSGSQVGNAISTAGIQTATSLVRSLYPYTNVSSAVALKEPSSLFPLGDSPLLSSVWYLDRLQVISYLPWLLLLVSFVSIVYLSFKFHLTRVSIGYNALFALVIGTLGFLTLGIHGFLGLEILLIRIVPGWAATRNYYEVFAIPYVLVVSVSLGVFIGRVLQFIGEMKRLPLLRVVNVVIVGSTIAAGVLGGQLLSGTYVRLSYFNNVKATNAVVSLPRGYARFVRYIHRTDPFGSMVSLPLSTTSWTVLRHTFGGRRASVTYIGQSPMFFLYGQRDFNGLDSFGGAGTAAGNMVSNAMTTGDVKEVSALLRFVGVDWAILESPIGISGAVDTKLVEGVNNKLMRLDQAIVVKAGYRHVSTAGNYQLWRIPIASECVNGVSLAAISKGDVQSFDKMLADWWNGMGMEGRACGARVVIKKYKLASLFHGFELRAVVVVRHRGLFNSIVVPGIVLSSKLKVSLANGVERVVSPATRFDSTIYSLPTIALRSGRVFRVSIGG